MKRYGVIGTSFRESSTDFQAHLHVPEDHLAAVLAGFRDACGFDEVVYLATCNRVDIVYAREDGADPEVDLGRVIAFLGDHVCRSVRDTDVAPAATVMRELEDRSRYHRHAGEEAVRYLFRVAASIDSMVIGEAQILGQVKDACAQAQRLGFVGLSLKRLFDATFGLAKQVRNRTGLGTGALSMASLAVQAIEESKVHADAAVALVGSGPMTRKAAKRLARRGFRNLVFVNRTVDKVRALAASHDGRAVSLADFLADPDPCDVILSATSAPRMIFTRETIEPILARRAGHGTPSAGADGGAGANGSANANGNTGATSTLLLVDLAVPRDIDPDLDRHDRVRVVAVDDLRAIAERNADDRAGRARQAESFVDRGLESFSRKLANPVPAAASRT